MPGSKFLENEEESKIGQMENRFRGLTIRRLRDNGETFSTIFAEHVSALRSGFKASLGYTDTMGKTMRKQVSRRKDVKDYV